MEAKNCRLIGHLDIPGGGQVVVQGKQAFIGQSNGPTEHPSSMFPTSSILVSSAPSKLPKVPTGTRCACAAIS